MSMTTNCLCGLVCHKPVLESVRKVYFKVYLRCCRNLIYLIIYLRYKDVHFYTGSDYTVTCVCNYMEYSKCISARSPNEQKVVGKNPLGVDRLHNVRPNSGGTEMR